jgi:uncharacterized RDD family membrane protein YckC
LIILCIFLAVFMLARLLPLIILCIFLAVFMLARLLPNLNPTGVMKSLPRTWLFALGVFAYGVVDLGYFLIFEALWSGQTPGKRVQKRAVRPRERECRSSG